MNTTGETNTTGTTVEVSATALVRGLEEMPVTVRATLARGLPAFELSGVPEVAVREMRTRVRAALEQSGAELPLRRVDVAVEPHVLGATSSPAALDLAVAVATALAAGKLDAAGPLASHVLVGELSLRGELRGVRGLLAMLDGARERGATGAIVADEQAHEAAAAARDGFDVRVARSLREVLDALAGRAELPTAGEFVSWHAAPVDETAAWSGSVDLASVATTPAARRALELAAAGGHHVLLVGPPGGGKTLLARALAGIMPAMTEREAREVTAVHSLAGVLRERAGLVSSRPFRAPHHTCSGAGLVGGGASMRPGECALAHRGVLFLDELPEFPRETLEAVRGVLLDGAANLARAGARASYLARFTLVAATNPCPCGWHGEGDGCECPTERVRRYRDRVASALLERFDVVVRLTPAAATVGVPRPSRAASRDRVAAALERRAQRPAVERVTHANAGLHPLARQVLDEAATVHGATVSELARAVRVARTLADLDGFDRVQDHHVGEALSFSAANAGWTL